MKVEVEGKEGFIENSFGDRAIIPKDKWGEVQKMIDEGCYDCIDRFVANLPKYSDYAATGSTIPSDQRSPSVGSEVPEEGKNVLERIKSSQTHEMTRSNYPKYDEQAINRQLEFHQDLQYAEETGIEDDFRKKWGTSVHRWKYDHDPEYKASYTLSPQEQKRSNERHGTIGFPITDVRRSAPYNSQFMYPQLQGEAQAKQARISNEIIQAGLPIPGLNKVGKIPGLLDEALGLAGKALPNSATTIASSVDDVAIQASKQTWRMEEIPGLHLKSTMEGGSISKIVEPKTGLVNVEQALGIIGKESGGAEKVAMIRKGLGDKLLQKMDYNKFRKVVQEQLIPLERRFSTQASNYGINKLGYLPAKRESYNKSIEFTKQLIAKGDDIEANTIQLNKLLKEYEQLPLENQTLILGNKSKFGRGSSAHGNPEETLGHIHFLRDAETPDVLTVTQIQSDAFQGTHRVMPKTFDKEQQLRSLARMEDIAKKQEEMAKGVGLKKIDENTYMLEDGTKVSKSTLEQMGKSQREINAMKKAEIENFTQKQLLDKNHQERYLQELVDYAGKRGDVNKIRVPTSETAAKIQGYNKIDYTTTYADGRTVVDKIDFPEKHQTILKKYKDNPKLIKKLFGEEPKIVTDSKGNTWYEFDIPKAFKEGKGEIKAFEVIPGAIAVGAASQLKQE